MSGYNNGLGFNPFAGGNVPNNALNLPQQFAQNMAGNANVPNATFNATQLAILAQQQRQQQQQQAGQHMASMQTPMARHNSPTPQQLLDNLHANAAVNQRQVPQGPSDQHQQLTAAISEVVSNPNLKPEIRKLILGGHIPAEKILELAQKYRLARQMSAAQASLVAGSSNQSTQTQGFSPAQGIRHLPTSVSPALMSKTFSPAPQSSPNTTPIPLAAANQIAMQAQIPSAAQGYLQSSLGTPPLPSDQQAVPSPPRIANRRTSTSQNAPTTVINPSAVQKPPSTASNTAANPAIAAVIPPVPPPSFKLDESKLKTRNTVNPSAGSSTGNAQTSNLGSTSTVPSTSSTTGPSNTQPSSILSTLPPMPTPTQRTSISYLPTPSTSYRPPAPPRPAEGRYLEFAGERRKGMEGMRGSMRNEIARLMYAAGDEPEPDVNSVDYMEDLVVEFLSDLSRPVAPMRANVGAPHYPVPLTTNIVRDRLASRPVFKKYLDRFDIMTYLTGEINKNRRTFQNQESYNDLVDTVGRDYLEMDAEEKTKVTGPKKRGRPRKTEGKEIGEDGTDEPQAKRKPGPKKGWKAARVAGAVRGETAEAPRIGADGRKIKKKYQRKKKENTAGVRETSVVSGGEGTGYASPA